MVVFVLIVFCLVAFVEVVFVGVFFVSVVLMYRLASQHNGSIVRETKCNAGKCSELQCGAPARLGDSTVNACREVK